MKTKTCPKCSKEARFLIPYRSLSGLLLERCYDCEDKAYKIHREPSVLLDIKRPKLFGK